jgi:DEAD/DEAH box helicase domain-containing protein
MLKHYQEDISWESFGGLEGPLTLARMFLVREFGRRPKRLNNLESMGLVAVCYPGLEAVQSAAAGFTLVEWRDLLKISLDFFVRAGGSLAVDPRTRHWLGTKFPRRDLVVRDREAINRYEERRWLRAKRSSLRSPLVRLLAYALKADIETAYGLDLIDDAVAALWKALTEEAGILRTTEGGRRTLPLDALAFAPSPPPGSAQ